MKKFCFVLFLGLAIFIGGMANADVLQLPAGGYTTPKDWTILSEVSPIDLDHYSYYQWSIPDIICSRPIPGLNIVFHNISDWMVEADYLNVYIKDTSTPLYPSYQWAGIDDQSLTAPNWDGVGGLGYTKISGTWSDPTGGGNTAYDVVFSTSDSTLLSYINNGGYFNIGIDPDCHYSGEKITVESVPEPGILLLLGFGLVGVAGFARMKFKS